MARCLTKLLTLLGKRFYGPRQKKKKNYAIIPSDLERTCIIYLVTDQ